MQSRRLRIGGCYQKCEVVWSVLANATGQGYEYIRNIWGYEAYRVFRTLTSSFSAAAWIAATSSSVGASPR